MLPKLSQSEIVEKVNKIGFNFYPDLLLSKPKQEELLSVLYDKFPDMFQSAAEVGPGVLALVRSKAGLPQPEHSFVLTPKGGTLTFSDEFFQRDEFIYDVTVSTIEELRKLYPIRRIPRVGRIVEAVHRWSSEPSPHEWLIENFTVFKMGEDDISEVNFRFLFRSSGMNINTFFNPVRHRSTQDWGLQIVCDVNNIDTNKDMTPSAIRSVIDFSTLYFPDRTFEILNAHVK